MDIDWFGHSCFRLRSTAGVVVTDPPADGSGVSLPRLRADVVTISHGHPGHANLSAIDGDPFVVDGPGEYEVKGTVVQGVRVAHDDRGGQARGLVTAYCIHGDDVVVCHLGDLGHLPTQEQRDALGSIDVLLVPVGGTTTLGPAQAAEVVGLLDPALVVPMHFRSPQRPDLEPLSRFLQEMGVVEPPPVPTLSVTRLQLPTEPQVVVLALRP